MIHANLTSAEVLAVAKVAEKSKKTASGNLAEGEYPIKITVTIEGMVKRGADYPQRIVPKADFAAIAAVALSKVSPATREKILREALDADPELIAQIKTEANEAILAIKGTTWTECNGKVTHDLTLTVVEDGAASEAA
jgi:hypothetical protein